jgi:hypothetical protein
VSSTRVQVPATAGDDGDDGDDDGGGADDDDVPFGGVRSKAESNVAHQMPFA